MFTWGPEATSHLLTGMNHHVLEDDYVYVLSYEGIFFGYDGFIWFYRICIKLDKLRTYNVRQIKHLLTSLNIFSLLFMSNVDGFGD